VSSNVWPVCICLLTAAHSTVTLTLSAQHRSLTRITFATEVVAERTNESNPAIWNQADSIHFHLSLYAEAPYGILELISLSVSVGLASSSTAVSVSLSSRSVDALSVLDVSLGLSHRYLRPRVTTFEERKPLRRKTGAISLLLPKTPSTTAVLNSDYYQSMSRSYQLPSFFARVIIF
jgi:hypothetical protein